MKFARRRVFFVFVVLLLAIGAGVLGSALLAQEEGWQIVRADYGWGNQRVDVTNLVRDLIRSGGVNGRIAVTNQTMGGDPAVGADKHLRIFARRMNPNGGWVEREFDYKESGWIDARMYVVRREDGDDRRPDADRDRDRDHDRGGDRDRDRDRDAHSLMIVCAYYGTQGHTVNVTDLLRSQVRERGLNIPVGNASMGGDPAVGYDKVLIVVYNFRGVETATAVREGAVITIP